MLCTNILRYFCPRLFSRRVRPSDSNLQAVSRYSSTESLLASMSDDIFEHPEKKLPRVRSKSLGQIPMSFSVAARPRSAPCLDLKQDVVREKLLSRDEHFSPVKRLNSVEIKKFEEELRKDSRERPRGKSPF